MRGEVSHLFRIPVRAIRAALAAWPLVTSPQVRSIPGGVTGDCFLVRSGPDTFVAKFTYDDRETVERGLRAAALVQESTGMPTGRPLRTRTGELTVMVEGPPDHEHPLALLEFVPGRPLDWRSPHAPRIIGETLGTIHGALLSGGFDGGEDHQLDAYLERETVEIAEAELVRTAAREAIASVRAFEAAHSVTRGAIYGDGLEVLIEHRTRKTGLVDWGTVSREALLCDVAIAAPPLRRLHGEGSFDRFLEAYLVRSPVSQSELEGLVHYERLISARQARYHAFRAMRGSHYGQQAAEHSALLLSRHLAELGHPISDVRS